MWIADAGWLTGSEMRCARTDMTADRRPGAKQELIAEADTLDAIRAPGAKSEIR
jgi:hypothetical protein